ncbi:hypothetical protein ACH5AR_15830, partial [Kitasatospora sp. NPDC018619]|uniref:hypothetical protein n=1 Tax=Kitasatospora sp. NPDC018619 TaxID=3364028 RepID=UPI00378E5F40
MERLPAQLPGQIGGGAGAVDPVQQGLLTGGEPGRGGGVRPHQRRVVGARVGPDAVQQVAAAQRLALQRGDRHRQDGTEPVGDAVAETARGAARGEGEVRGVVE